VVRVEPPTSARPGDKAVITADGRLRGWIGGSCSEPVVRREALRALAEGIPQLVKIVAAEEVRQTRKRGELMVATTCPSGGSLDIFIEPRLPRPLLLVFGETPVAETLAKLGELTGFRAKTVSHAGLASLSVPATDAWAVVATMGHFDEDAAEAALALAGTHSAAAFKVLKECFGKGEDPWWRSVLLSAISLTRQPEALEFLLELVRTESLSAEGAIEALLRSSPSQEVVQSLRLMVAGNPRLKHVFVEQQKDAR